MTTTRRISRVVVVLGVAAVALLGAAVNLWLLEPHGASPGPVLVDGPPSSTTTTTPVTASTDTTAPPATALEPGRPYVVGEAGTVWIALRDGRVVVEDIVASEGWTYEVDEEPDKVEVRFRRGDDALKLEAELRDGQLQVEVESEDELDD
ncbi:MAG: hypothetical protein ACSLFP_16635 [Acidimicrobiales bacterium]